MIILTAEQIRRVEQNAVDNGMDFLRLMENAGAASARYIRERVASMSKTDISNITVTIVSGKGKNGGDGFVIARKLCENGMKVNVILADSIANEGDAGEMFERLDGMPVNIFRYALEKEKVFEIISKSNVLVDCVFGIGFRGTPTEEMSKLFVAMSSNKGYKVAIDVPSGVNCDTGEVEGEAVMVNETIAISTLKPAHVLVPASLYCGNTAVVRIGIPEEIIKSIDSKLCCADKNEISSNFKERNPLSNKGDYGRVLSICGSTNMPGAAVLAANGAVNSGAGLVTAVFPEKAYSAISSKLTEPLLLPLDTNRFGTLSKGAAPMILSAMEKASVILIGCGIGVNEDTREIVTKVLLNAKCPVVIDADGLNIISENIDILKQVKVDVVLTPHPGEMSRLMGVSVDEIQAKRTEYAQRLAYRYPVTVVLKGANTIITKYDKNRVYINTTGNPGMARGGSGDLLAGIIASFIAQGIKPFNAAYCGAYVHGLAGDKAAKKYSMASMTPTDMITELKCLL
ncbi:MAG: NAD(P)H-hydrate dehydratase [Clostridiales bacterium]|nr:NAD(P)H-hydrate dehydratase [Clostridiales bacterium]